MSALGRKPTRGNVVIGWKVEIAPVAAPVTVWAMLSFVGAALTAALAVTVPTSNGSSKSVGFQATLDHAWKSTLANRHSGILMSAKIKSGESFRMQCLPTQLLKNSRLSISIGQVALPRNYSLISIDKGDRIAVIASTTKDGYIGDNIIQPELIRTGAVLTTEASTTYGHLNNTGYPYPAFGPGGRHLILLVDDAIIFGPRGIGTRGGKTPHVVAGCMVNWHGFH